MLIDNLKAQILSRMKEKNLGPTELEKQAGLNRGTASNILYGRSKNPSIETLHSIATVLNCTIDDLIVDLETSSKKNIAKTQYELLVDLLHQVLDYSVLYVKDQGYTPTFDQFLSYVREAYIYSLTKNNKKLDKSFIEWFIDNNIR